MNAPMRRLIARAASVALMAAACITAHAQDGAPAPRGFGVMVHYLPDAAGIAQLGHFDVEALAQALAAMRARYLVLTLGQNNGQYIAPNGALEALCPAVAAQRPPRDLPLDIGRALQARGIALVLYLPFRAPQAAPALMRCLGDVDEQLPPPPRFIAAWSAVVRDWSERYGPLVAGWWFDGTYNTRGITAEGWRSLCDAATSGRQDRWLAFNPGEGPTRFDLRAAPCQNLMAGEFMDPPARPTPRVATRADGEPMAFHLMTPLSAHWGRPGPARFDEARLRGWIAQATAQGGLFTLDLPLDAQLRLLPEHVALVRRATTPR